MNEFLTESDYRIAAENGLDRSLVYRRVNDIGWSIERAIMEPVHQEHRATGAWERWKDVAVVNYQTFRTRLSRGKSEEMAALTPAKKPRGRTAHPVDMSYLTAQSQLEEGMTYNA